VLPDDDANRALLAHVHPPGWTNPTPAGRYNLVVVGAGTAGLVSAAGAAGLGARVALVERALMGGDCLNVGCVPSKAIIGAARIAQLARDSGTFGVRTGAVEADFAGVMARMRRLRASIAPTDGAPRFQKLGVDVYLGEGRFTSPTTVEVDGRTLEFARAVIATGARATAPPIPGLDRVDYLTNETIFWLTELPRRLGVIGGGPIGCEMAQAFRRLGADVTVLNADPHVLPREDADAAAIVERRLAAEGVRLANGVTITRAEQRGAEVVLAYTQNGTPAEITVDRVLVAAGRAPNVEGLGLEAAGVAYDRQGVEVNDYLQTTNPSIYAAGDVCSRWQFTHTADALARIVLTNALFLGRKKASALVVPWCTYTSPEVAHVGLYERDAAAQGLATDTITVPLHDVDRARLDGEDEGFFRVVLAKGTDRILGATLVAAHAGDMISEVTAAMTGKMGLGALANVIHPYPTQAEAIKKAADAWNRTRLTPLVKRIFAWWLATRRR
jgi:pyruvate/2-oxoglutarate dehydrogenase complex dihydrolipoamide dehydrogenase (E3) component